MISKFAYFVAVFALSAIASFKAPLTFAISLADSTGSTTEVARSSDINEQGNSRKYLILGLSYNNTSASSFRDKDCSSTTPASLYGCGTGNDGRPIAAYGDFGKPAGLEFGVGLHSPANLRYELTLQVRPDISFSGNANFKQTTDQQPVTAKLSVLSFMASGYVDLVGSGDSHSGRFKPYIGAGVGLSRIKIGQTTMTFPVTATLVPGGTQTSFSWLFALGVSKELEGLGTLDLSWRYMDFGRVETPRGPGAVVWHDGSRTIDLDLAPTRARLTSSGIRIALRRDF